jgi:hypothetical protein
MVSGSSGSALALESVPDAAVPWARRTLKNRYRRLLDVTLLYQKSHAKSKIRSTGLFLKGWAVDGYPPTGSHEPIADTFTSRTFFVAVISGCFAIRTLFPIAVSHGICICAVAALSVNGLAAATVYDLISVLKKFVVPGGIMELCG